MFRDTKQRKAILQYVQNSKAHPTADLIYESLRQEIPNISKGTVYRNLKVLTERKQLSELRFKGKVSRFEGRQDSHYHFRCEVCDRVFDIDAPVDEALNGQIAVKTGLKILSHQIEFRGLCKDCQQ
jgi:Fur family transcriptional regulator, peroxide stress response regulator